MAMDIALYAIVVTFFILVIVILPVFGILALRRRMLRDHVWIDMRFRKGTRDRWLAKPDDDGSMRTKWGRYFTRNDAFDLFDGGWRRGGLKPMFEYLQGCPFPLKPGKKIVGTRHQLAAANGGEPTYEISEMPQVIPAETVKTYFDQHDYADAYSGRSGLFILLAIGLIVLFLLIAGLYVRR